MTKKADSKAIARVAEMMDVPVANVDMVRAGCRHKCKKCPQPIEMGEIHFCVYYGKGLSSLKFPDRYHLTCL